MIIMYSASCNGQGEKLLQVLKTVVSEGDIKLYQTIEALSIGLRQPRNDVNAAVLMVSSRVELYDLITIRSLLWDMKVILILPDSDPNTVTEGHILRPRFLVDCHSNFQDVAAVLNRMIGNRDTDNKEEARSRMEKSMKSTIHWGLHSQSSKRE
jgi:hypothetical protein